MFEFNRKYDIVRIVGADPGGRGGFSVQSGRVVVRRGGVTATLVVW